MLSLMLETNFLNPSSQVSQSKIGQIVFRDLQTDMTSPLCIFKGLEGSTSEGVNVEAIGLFFGGFHLFGLKYALLKRLEAFYNQHNSVLLIGKLLGLFKLGM